MVGGFVDLTKDVFSSKLVKSQAEILELIYKLKRSEYRGEQAEMNIQRLNVRIDQVCNLLLVFIFLVCLFCNVKIRDVPAFLLSQVCFNDLQIRWRRICSARSTRSKSEFQIHLDPMNLAYSPKVTILMMWLYSMFNK